MDWLDRMNAALDYMENNLDGDISVDEIARISCMSGYHFHRMFSYIAEVTLSEYLRRRRLTKAAFDLQNGDKVIDVALRYGYDSPTAFNRAFQTIQGITPSAAGKPDTVLKAYPRINFQITIKGVNEMEYRIVKKEAFRIVGVREPLELDLSFKSHDGLSIANVEGAFKRIPMFWQETKQSGKITQIVQFIKDETDGLLGVTACRGNNEQSYYYIAAATNESVPDGMYEEIIPACTWAIFSGEGVPNSIQELMARIYSEWLPASGYEWNNAPDIEVYLNDDPVNMKYEVWLPVVKKA